MSPWLYRLFHVFNLSVILTGVVYAWMRYALKPLDEYAVVNHPWQPAVQHLHVLVAPGLVFLLGSFFFHHGIRHFRAGLKTGRKSGVLQLASAMPMIFSGVALQVTVSQFARSMWLAIHLGTSMVWILGCVFHWVAARRNRRPQSIPGV